MNKTGSPAPINWPTTWRSVPLWALFDRVKDLGHPDEEMLSVYREHGVVRKSSRNDNHNQTVEDRSIYQLVDKGWFIVNRMKAWQGAVGISSLRGVVSGHYLCFRPKHNEDPRFLNWLLRSNIYALEYARMSRGVRPGQIEIDNDDLRGLRIVLPSRDEQHHIASFLEAATCEVDKVLRSRDLQLNALEELRLSTASAIIPDARQVPFVRLGYLATIQSGITIDAGRKPDSDSVTLPYLRVANVQDGYVDLGSVQQMRIDRSVARTAMLKHGDVLMTEGGDLDKLGRGAVWLNQVKDCLHQNHVFAIRPDRSKIVPAYLALITRTAYARSYFESTGTRTTNLASTNGSKIRNFRIPLVDTAIQDQLSADANEKLQEIKEVELAVRGHRDLFVERRQALISAALTGRIDGAIA